MTLDTQLISLSCTNSPAFQKWSAMYPLFGECGEKFRGIADVESSVGLGMAVRGGLRGFSRRLERAREKGQCRVVLVIAVQRWTSVLFVLSRCARLQTSCRDETIAAVNPATAHAEALPHM